MQDKNRVLPTRAPTLPLLSAFTAHPASVNETYAAHAGFAFGFALRLFAAGAAALVHAVLPFLFQTTASRMIREMCARMDRRAEHPEFPEDTGEARVQMDRRV